MCICVWVHTYVHVCMHLRHSVSMHALSDFCTCMLTHSPTSHHILFKTLKSILKICSLKMTMQQIRLDSLLFLASWTCCRHQHSSLEPRRWWSWWPYCRWSLHPPSPPATTTRYRISFTPLLQNVTVLHLLQKVTVLHLLQKVTVLHLLQKVTLLPLFQKAQYNICFSTIFASEGHSTTFASAGHSTTFASAPYLLQKVTVLHLL